ncbi:odorant receptor 13a-like [Microplitis mediator]|uniref:odorant receptor 13a-like n=1 Tax=Microplitis mediator TaxID=375433 RepID=UPI0025526FD6|nr:odorant receptor 13a-like [Microplitis mediator]
MEVHSRDQRDLDKGARVFTWARLMSKCIGVWPLEPNYHLFNICFFYFTYIMITEYINLYYCLPNFKKVLGNLVENLAFTHMYVRTLMLRVHINKLRYIISESLKDYHASAYQNSEEVNEFLIYVRKGKFFVKAAGIFVISTATSWYIRPITSPSLPNNETAVFTYILPYKFHIFYKISNYRTYVLTYLSHAPFAIISGVGAVTSAWILIMLSFHVTGRLAILAKRINSLKDKNGGYRNHLDEIIFEHSRLLEMGEGIKSSYAIALLIYFVNGTILLCIIGYQILVTITLGVKHNLMPYFVFILTVYLVISIFCILSENLLAQSNKVSEAFWSCEWYKMPQDCVKDITFCILRSQKTLGLTAGAFLTFSNSTLTDVTKTAMGYLSILRNFLIVE